MLNMEKIGETYNCQYRKIESITVGGLKIASVRCVGGTFDGCQISTDMVCFDCKRNSVEVENNVENNENTQENKVNYLVSLGSKVFHLCLSNKEGTPLCGQKGNFLNVSGPAGVMESNTCKKCKALYKESNE